MTHKSLFFVVLLGTLASSVGALWPVPRSLTTGTFPVKLSSAFVIHLQGNLDAPSDLLSAISCTRTRLSSDKFQRLVLGRGATDAQAIQSAHVLTSLNLVLQPGSPVRSIAEESTRAIESKSESYQLSVPNDRAIATLTANSTLGLLRGLTTFEQLWYDYKGAKYMLDGPVQIADEPAFVGFA